MDNRDRLIVAQVAYKAAVDAGIKDPDEIHIFAQDMFDGIFQLAGHRTQPAAVDAAPSAEQAVDNVVRAFPGATTVQDDDDEALSDEPPHQPDTKVPAEVKANKRWAVATLHYDIENKQFFKAWWDNTETAAGTKRPLLKHKHTGIALWAEDIDGITIPKSKFAK
jgi:hypothetical protein